MSTRQRISKSVANDTSNSKEEEEIKVKDSKGYWFSKNPSKNWAEKFFLAYTVYWIFLFAIVVGTKLYEVIK
jgi:hypothetical protein